MCWRPELLFGGTSTWLRNRQTGNLCGSEEHKFWYLGWISLTQQDTGKDKYRCSAQFRPTIQKKSVCKLSWVELRTAEVERVAP